MTWSKALTFSHNASVGSDYWTNVVIPYFTWMNTQPGITTVVNPYQSGGVAGIRYVSTRFGNTYDHGYIYQYTPTGSGNMRVHDWPIANRPSNNIGTLGDRKRDDTYFQMPTYASDYEVWQSDEHKSWIVFEQRQGSSAVYIRGAFMDPSHLTQGAELAGRAGWRETAVIADSFYILGNVDDTSNTFVNMGFMQSIWDRKSPTILIKNFYSLFQSTYSINITNTWAYTAIEDIGYAYMATPNDIHTSGSTSGVCSVMQLDSDPNYYINTGAGGGMFLDCGTSVPNFFGYGS